jgi:outer membrane biosynthesis protein TonB
VAVPVALLLLTGCASSPEAEVREGVRDVIAAANDQDADAVRGAVDDLLSTLRTQVGSGELTDAEAAPVRDAALAIRNSVVALEVEETPSPTPTPEPTASPTPSPTPTPTPEETESPTPTPEPTPEPPEQTEPPETEAPETEVPDTEAPEDEGEDDQATVVPELPAVPLTPAPAG